jgi:hypothetical protein
MVTKKRAVIFNLDNPSPVAYMNIYEESDIWIKTQGCEACPEENRMKCCNNCGMFSERKGCVWHVTRNLDTTNKPWNCMVKPYPDAAMPFCALEFTSISGRHKGAIRRVKDRGDIFQTG